MTHLDRPRLLVIGDWVTDPQEAARAIGVAVPSGDTAQLTIVVPARLHGLDWIGDPHASGPCAEAHQLMLAAACRAMGLSVVAGWAGDPDPIAAAGDALLDDRYDEVIVLHRRRMVPAFLRTHRRLARVQECPVRAVRILGSAPHHQRHCSPRELSFAGWQDQLASG